MTSKEEKDENSKEVRRITISLDDETARIINELTEEESKNISEVVRGAIQSYYKIKSKGLKPEALETISELLSEREHVIVDIGLWTAILEEINKNAENNFWKIVGEIGKEYGILLKNKNLKRVYDILKYMESSNWYRVKTISNGTYVLVLTVKAEVKILSYLLREMFKSLGIPVEIIEGWRKLIVIEKMFDENAEIVKKFID